MLFAYSSCCEMKSLITTCKILQSTAFVGYIEDCQHNIYSRGRRLSQLNESHIHVHITSTSPLTSLHLPVLTSRIHASCRVLPFLSHPPVTSSCGHSSPQLRQQASWEDLSTGQGAPSALSSLVHSWDK